MKTSAITEIALGIIGMIIRIAAVIVVAMFIINGASRAYDLGYRVYTEPAKSAGSGRTMTVTITPKMNALKIGELLEEKGIVNDGQLFALQYMLSESRKKVKPGTYTLSSTMTAEEIMKAMAPPAEEEGDS